MARSMDGLPRPPCTLSLRFNWKCEFVVYGIGLVASRIDYLPNIASEAQALEERELCEPMKNGWMLLPSLVALACGGDEPEITTPTTPTSPPPPNPLEVERDALVALYNATGGPSWTRRDNWLTGAPVNDWYGVATSLNGRVYNLDLRNNELAGSIPPDIEKLEDMVGLFLNDNELTGSIPAGIGRLSRLEYLDLGANGLTGTIPPIGSLRLVSIRLVDNGLTGSIPPELGRLSRLEQLNLSANGLTGAIPPELQQLSRLEGLSLADNGLTGPIPAELGQLSRLKSLRLGSNELTGPIPAALGRLSVLEHLDLSTNKLTGGLPGEVGNLKRLSRLELSSNPDLSGLMPRSLLRLRELGSFRTRGTQLCAPLDRTFTAWLERVGASVDVCDVAVVERLALEGLFNATAGDAWFNAAGWNTVADLGSWHGVTVEDGRVRSLKLPDNGLTGPFPTSLVTLAELRQLDLSGNNLAGRLSTDIGHMSSLATLDLADNAGLDGLLPFSMTGLSALAVLRYGGTSLCIPPTRSFEAWVTGLDVHEGPICEDLPGVALAFPMVYTIQSIQKPSSPLPMVANRDALLRVFLTAPTVHDFIAPPILATFSRDGEEVYRVRIEAPDHQLPTGALQVSLDGSYNAVIPGEHIQSGLGLQVEADPDGSLVLADDAENRYPAEGAVAIDVVEVPPMEVTVVPVLNATAPDSSIFNWVTDVTKDSHIVSMLRWAFPFSEFSARTRETYVTSRDLTTGDGQWGLILDLEAVRSAENGTGYYYGTALSKTGLVRGRARLGGWVSMGKPLVTELAHEVGHSLNLSHAPCGDAGNPDPDFPYPGGSIGVWGYDFRDGTVVSRGAADVMGYCHPAWISDFSYRKVLDHRRTHRLTSSSVPRSPQLVLGGGVVDGKLTLEPPYWLRMSPSTPSGQGPYLIEGFSGADPVFSFSFTPTWDKHGNRYFLFALPVEPGDVDRVVLRGPEGEVVVDERDSRTVTILRSQSGLIRGLLHDWNDDIPETPGHADAVTYRGLRETRR